MLQIRNFIYIQIHRRLVLTSMRGREQKNSGIKSLLLLVYLHFFPTPSPHNAKIQTLLKYGGRGVWVETGTYEGQTAEILAKTVSQVHTIEPSEELFTIARNRLSSFDNVIQHKGTSEEVLSKVLSILYQDSCEEVNFWLDGHYSAGNTYMGSKETPILDELTAIEHFISKFPTVNIFVDDVRCFAPTTEEYKSYPSLKSLMEWSEKYSLTCLLHRDILIMRNRKK